jgi:hypothetical protein
MTALAATQALHRLACTAFLQFLYGPPRLSISRLYTQALDNAPHAACAISVFA